METININNQENNKVQVINQITQEVLAKYELFDVHYILEGFSLVGIKNLGLWINIVKQIDETKGLANLPHYVSLMKNMERKNLLEGLEKLESNDLYSFENLIFGLYDFASLESKSL